MPGETGFLVQQSLMVSLNSPNSTETVGIEIARIVKDNRDWTSDASKKAIDTLDENPQLVQKLRSNVSAARHGIGEVGFEVLESPTAICPIIVGETATAIAMSNALLEMGCFAIGFGYPVVPEGTARIRVQISAAHEQEHIERLCVALASLRKQYH